jgi:hypothetical protein
MTQREGATTETTNPAPALPTTTPNHRPSAGGLISQAPRNPLQPLVLGRWKVTPAWRPPQQTKFIANTSRTSPEQRAGAQGIRRRGVKLRPTRRGYKPTTKNNSTWRVGSTSTLHHLLDNEDAYRLWLRGESRIANCRYGTCTNITCNQIGSPCHVGLPPAKHNLGFTTAQLRLYRLPCRTPLSPEMMLTSPTGSWRQAALN